MLKRFFLISVFLISILLMTACGNDDNPSGATLPNLSGKNKTEVLSELAKLKIDFSFDEEINLEVQPGLFTRYGNDLKAGDQIQRSTSVVVFFSAEINGVILPDLSDLDQEGIIDILIELDVFIQFQTVDTNEVAEGLFVRYGNQLSQGDIVDFGSTVIVLLARKIVDFNSGLIISKYVEGMSGNKAIEISNRSTTVIDLSEYRLSLFLNGDETPTEEIILTGNLSPDDVYIVVYSESDQGLKDKANLISNRLLFDGNDAVAITKEGRVVDIIGNIGWTIFILRNETFVRKPHIVENSRTYNVLDWDIYARDNYSMLGSHPVEFPTSFTFNPEQLLIPYTTPGGMTKVTYGWANDGDTSTFSPGFEGSARVRFIGINTPEMTGSEPNVVYPEPWAVQATESLRSMLESATDIYVMHDPVNGMVDTYNRSLGLVWADGVLTNYIQVLRGYSINAYNDENQTLIFNGVSLFRWFERAQREAQANKVGIWSSGS